MRIGNLATQFNLPTRTIRFYERRGLLPEPERLANGYRVYDQTAVERVGFIRRAQTAGLTLAEIRGILEVRAEGRNPCAHVNELLHAKLSEVDQRMVELEALRTDLETLVERSRTLDPVDCTAGEICHILQDTAN